MKNIPTEMIDKRKTYDRKSDLSRVTGIDDGEEETVLDLTVKKGMKNGPNLDFERLKVSNDRFGSFLG